MAAAAAALDACSGNDTSSGASPSGTGGSGAAGSRGAAAGGAGAPSSGGATSAGAGGAGGKIADASTPKASDASLPDAGTAPDASSPGGGLSLIFTICGATGNVCDGINAYAACVQNACGSALAQCFGPNNERSDFTGGSCSDYAGCVTAAVDHCHNGCTPSADCGACLGTLSACVQGSPCTAPRCTGGSGTGDGGSPRDGGTQISGTCADLEACCAAISDQTSRDACNSTLADARARAGDADCAIVFSTYRSAGICK
jgi:hypothetical protein